MNLNKDQLSELKRILRVFKRDCGKYNINLAILRGWKYAQKLNIFDNRVHFENYIYQLSKLSKKYQTDFFD